MPISAAEQSDLEALKAKKLERAERLLSYTGFLLRADQKTLEASGYKSIEAALLYAVREAHKDIEKLHTAHFRKYPD